MSFPTHKAPSTAEHSIEDNQQPCGDLGLQETGLWIFPINWTLHALLDPSSDQRGIN